MGTMADISTPATSTAKGDLQDDKTHASQPLSNAEDPKIDSGGAIDSTNLNSRAKPKKRTKAARWQKAKQREIRRAKEKEIQLAEKRAEMEKQIAAVISLVQTDIQNLVETEKRKSEQYLSLARKYYSMWKILNDERSRQKSTSMKKQTSPQENDSTFDVSFLGYYLSRSLKMIQLGVSFSYTAQVTSGFRKRL